MLQAVNDARHPSCNYSFPVSLLYTGVRVRTTDRRIHRVVI
jgi:hypothetical protein